MSATSSNDRLRVEFITPGDDPLYILPFFDEFFGMQNDDLDIIAVSACRTMGKRSRKKMVQELTALYGVTGFVRLSVETVAKRAAGSLPTSQRTFSLKQLCKARGIPYIPTSDPNGQEHLDGMKARRPDVVVSVACPFILKAPFIAIPPRGCINIHHAPLPKYKGMMPTFWQMFHGETRVGVTVHEVAAKIDEGAPFLQDSLAIEPGETLDHLIRRSKRHGAHCVAKVLHAIADGTAKPLPTTPDAGSYFTFPTIAEIKEFHRRGHRAI